MGKAPKRHSYRGIDSESTEFPCSGFRSGLAGCSVTDREGNVRFEELCRWSARV